MSTTDGLSTDSALARERKVPWSCWAARVDVRLRRALRQHQGVVRYGDVDPVWLLRNAVRGGKLTAVFPGVYVEQALADRLAPLGRQQLMRSAALRYLDGQGAVSHLSALAVWQVRQQSMHEPVHVTVAAGVRLRADERIVVHHHRDFDPGQQLRRGGLMVTSAAAALVDSWPLLPPAARVGPVVQTLEGGLATAAQVREHMSRLPKLKGGRSLRVLIDLIEAGCRSPLEIWGALEVFTGPEFARLRRQVPVAVGRQLFYLDLYARREKVNFELDGAAWHGSQLQRERDIRRDAALATLGILVVRFSYARLTSEPDAVRREALAILAARR